MKRDLNVGAKVCELCTIDYFGLPFSHIVLFGASLRDALNVIWPFAILAHCYSKARRNRRLHKIKHMARFATLFMTLYLWLQQIQAKGLISPLKEALHSIHSFSAFFEA